MAQLIMYSIKGPIVARKRDIGIIADAKFEDFGNPLDYFEISIALCIGKTLLGVCKESDLSPVEYRDIQVVVSNSSLRLSCICPIGYGQAFRDAIDTCYISNLVKLKKIIKIQELPLGY